MTGEEILRALADDCARNVTQADPEHRQAAIEDARPFLSGAFIALARANAFANRPSLAFLETLLAPIEQPLVDQGLYERVSFRLEVTTSAAAVADDEGNR